MKTNFTLNELITISNALESALWDGEDFAQDASTILKKVEKEIQSRGYTLTGEKINTYAPHIVKKTIICK